MTLPSEQQRPILADREHVLTLMARFIADAWASFDAPRPEEPPLDAALETTFAAPLPEEGLDPEEALADAARALDESHSPARPLYLAYIGSTGLEVGVVGEALAAAYDVNLATAARAADLVERQTLAWVAQFVGFPHADGAFTSGGMTSNLTALVAAREWALPGFRRDGQAGREVAVYCSEEAHHSVVRAVEVSGLGSGAVRRVGLDDRRRMRPGELDEALRRDREAGVVPIAVVANGGTTLTGAVDSLDAVAEVCDRHGVWMHVDGAYGLPAAAAPSTAPLFAGLARARSVTLDAHKWLGVQKSCSVVLLREADALRAAFGHDEHYMLHREGADNNVDHTLEYSRPFRSLKLWLAFRVHGAAAFRAWIEHTLGLARELAALVDADPAFELLHRPELSTVCFRHLPPGATELDAHNARLAHATQDDGRVYLAPALVDGRVCLRVCLVNFRTQLEEMGHVLAIVRELGDRLAGDEG